jgi:hypothetical protein
MYRGFESLSLRTTPPANWRKEAKSPANTSIARLFCFWVIPQENDRKRTFFVIFWSQTGAEFGGFTFECFAQIGCRKGV